MDPFPPFRTTAVSGVMLSEAKHLELVS